MGSCRVKVVHSETCLEKAGVESAAGDMYFTEIPDIDSLTA